MKNPDSHLWLYAKNHYVRHAMMADLRVLLGERNDIEPACVRDGDVVDALLSIVVPRLKQGSEHALREFLVELAPEHAWKYEQQWSGAVPTPGELLAAKCLSYMSLCPVREKEVTLIELDPVDPLLLPVAYHGTRTDDTPAPASRLLP